MKILITNDDGLTSGGILAVKQAVEDLGDVTVVAPQTQQSGVGHAITLMKPLRIFKRKLADGSYGYAVTGTPTDSLIIGTHHIMDGKPDLVISGINIGENLSKSITTSGTLGATFEAASHHIPSIAVSLQIDREDLKFKDGVSEIDFTYAKKILRRVVKNVIKYGMPENTDILNLNIPAKPESDEIIQSHLANRMYTTDVEERRDPYGHPYYWIKGDIIMKDDENTDVNNMHTKNQPVITPLSLDMTVYEDIEKWLK
ncbi:5'/3'-nucleotidase SurE [Methanosphaera cuniculi]|uniref:5'-nucleotidase SurE n=1 Tax=Methanosphaera cuniculi TaxID=1077256 RepID=A0A2A2HEW3_9EURY|nr:5'/3'-nucleotidase SurE [Methanosphaera cuniculi]PAV07969.1 stationary phase survival protein SurE [Methanosphaera cuniculi]PWL08825.1 5'-nucleotidase SurE [Methanosphaera cuniculi]